MAGESGSTLVSADAVVGRSGQPTRVFGAYLISGAGGGGIVIFRNGTTASATAFLQIDGTASKGTNVLFSDNGVLFPLGCFCDIDANVSSVVVNAISEQATGI